MTTIDRTPVVIPTVEQLRSCVVEHRPPTIHPEAVVSTSDPSISPNAERLLRQVALNIGRPLQLEDHWKSIGVESGSIKNAVLDELRSRGLIRLERKGRSKRIHLYAAAWDLLGMTPPKGLGSGGATHKECVQQVAQLFKNRGYEVRIEQALGASKKRVDIFALGKQRVGIEVGLTSPAQEVKNIREDLESGSLDVVLLASTSPDILDEVKKLAARDDYLSRHSHRIRYFLLEGD